jgi:hypothetical protein
MVKANPIAWILEKDKKNPSVRYLALFDLLDRPADDPEVITAHRAVMTNGPVPAILEALKSDGSWVKPGGGYGPKYRGTVWQIMFLAELGANSSNERVRRGCEYLLSHSIARSGAFSGSQPPLPSGSWHCLNGNLLYALLRLGYAADPRVQAALEWQARAITGEGRIQYHESATAGPGFACGVNEGQPCGWGANKAMRALLAVPIDRRTPVIERAIETGAAFLLSRDPSVADYPYTGRVSSTWFKLGFPLSYWSDVLETAAVLVEAGYGSDSRLTNVFKLIEGKQDDQGRWMLENSLNGKMWGDIEQKGRPSKWVTLRALRVLKEAGLYVPAG